MVEYRVRGERYNGAISYCANYKEDDFQFKMILENTSKGYETAEIIGFREDDGEWQDCYLPLTPIGTPIFL